MNAIPSALLTKAAAAVAATTTTAPRCILKPTSPTTSSINNNKPKEEETTTTTTTTEVEGCNVGFAKGTKPPVNKENNSANTTARKGMVPFQFLLRNNKKAPQNGNQSNNGC